MSKFMSFPKRIGVSILLLNIALVSHLFAFSEGELGINANFMFNVKADFKNLGGLLTPTDPGPATGGGVDRIYDDGYNRVGLNGNPVVEVNGNPVRVTSFWGFDFATQMDNDADTLTLNSSRSLSSLDVKDADDSIQPGVEVFFKFPGGYDNRYDGEYNWGVRESISYFAIDIDDNSTVQGAVERISDTFALNGVRSSPYKGTFSGVGPFISDTPTTRETLNASASISGDRELEADMFSYSLGPYLDIYSRNRLNLSIDGGFLLTWIFSDFSFKETVTITTPTGPPDRRENRGSGRRSEFLFGGFVETTVGIKLNHNIAIQGGARYQVMEDFDHTENGQKAELDFTSLVILSIGLSYLF